MLNDMTKYFCDFCGKEIPHTFLAKDIIYNTNSDKLKLSIMILAGSPMQKFVMICEKCTMEEVARYFTMRVRIIENE